MPETDTQLSMLSETDSLIPTEAKANGGKFTSEEATGLVESHSKTEETAADIDLPEPRFTLVADTADHSHPKLTRQDGTLSDAEVEHNMETESEL
jgi:hypothetical protein